MTLDHLIGNGHKKALIEYWMEKARESLESAKSEYKADRLSPAINRVYYACFYAVGALLLSKGIKTSTHSGCIQKFGEHFINTGLISKGLGRHYSVLYENRLKGDYDDFIDFRAVAGAHRLQNG